MLYGGGTKWCRVRSDQQLQAHGGAAVTRVAARANLGVGRTWTYGCGWPDDVFQEDGDVRVYLLYSGSKWCHIKYEHQMEAFGGALVHIAAQSNIGEWRTWTQTCGWPDGFFKEQGNPRVYRLYEGTRWCWISSEDVMNAFGGWGLVRDIGANSDLGRWRSYSGECRHP